MADDLRALDKDALAALTPENMEYLQSLLELAQRPEGEVIVKALGSLRDRGFLPGWMLLSLAALETVAANGEATAIWLAAKTILEDFSHRLAVVDGCKLFVCRQNGCWTDATRPSAVVTAAIAGMLREKHPFDDWGFRRAESVRTNLLIVLENPKDYGVRSVRLDDFDRRPIFQLKNGGSLDARTLEILDASATAEHLLLDSGGAGLDYDPELLNAGDEHPGRRMAAHFETDKTKPPKFQLLKRMSYLLLGPTKAIDSAVMPKGDSGKTSWARWLSLSLPGHVAVLDAVVGLSAQGRKFTVTQIFLANKKLVVLDEADKIEKPPTSGAVNALTADFLTIEEKGENVREALRRGNVVMIGAAPPNLELAQGGPERLHWSFDGSAIGVMTPEVRALIDDPAAQCWLATHLMTWASELYQSGETAVDRDSNEAAASIHLAVANPLQAALAEILELDSTSSIWLEDIKTRLRNYPEVSQPVESRTLGAAMQHVFGQEMKSKSTTKEGRPARYYAGVRQN